MKILIALGIILTALYIEISGYSAVVLFFLGKLSLAMFLCLFIIASTNMAESFIDHKKN